MQFKKLLKHSFFSGFTLIELLVVISIILVTTGAGIAGFINFNERQQVQTKVKEIQTLMRSAQVKARAGEDADACQDLTPPRLLKGYVVRKLSDETVLERVCMTHENSNLNFLYQTRDTVTSDNTTVTMVNSSGDNGMVIFLALRGGVWLFPVDSDSLTVTVTSNSGNISYEFQVLSSGEITEGAFL